MSNSQHTAGYLDMELLRFSTCGNVDDGKSTLIGRLLYDSKAIFEDQLEAIERASSRRGEEEVNLALLTDGLRAEREQGITIDVAYRYFATPLRKFIIGDTPGHIQYTRNMVTGASTANVAIVLIDARNGVQEQTLRHSYIASLLRIPHVIIAINKMDLVGYSQERFEEIKAQYNTFREKLDLQDVYFVPICAKDGDNVVDSSETMTWYTGPSLMHLLETIDVSEDINLRDFRYPVQLVIRPQNDDFHDYRGYAGRIASGTVRVGDMLTALPAGRSSKVKSINIFEESVQEAFAPQSVSIELEDDVDVSRGDMLVKAGNEPKTGQEFEVMLCWMNQAPLKLRGKYVLRHTSSEMRCMVTEVAYKMNINTLEHNTENTEIGLNDIARATIKTTKPLMYDSYRSNRITGSLIIVDEGTNETVGAAMII